MSDLSLLPAPKRTFAVRYLAASGAIGCAGSGMVSRCCSAVGCETMRNAFESFRSRQNDGWA
jgi:hypothetical protein